MKRGICLCFFAFLLTFGMSQALRLDNLYQSRVFRDTDAFEASYLDSLSQAYDRATIDTVGFSLLWDLAYWWHTRSLTKADSFAKLGIRITTTANNQLWKARFQIAHGAILLRAEQLDEAFKVLEEAKTVVPPSDFPLLNTQLGYVAERKGDIATAAAYAEETLKVGERLNDLWAMAMAYSDLSNLFWKQGKFEEGLEYGLKSERIFEERGIEDLDYGFTLYIIGNNYLALENTEEALAYYEKSIQNGEQYGFYNNLSDAYISVTELYTALGEYNKAKEIGQQAIKYSELLDNAFLLMRSWLSIGKLNNLAGEFPQAIQSLQTCLQIATEDFGDEFYLQIAYKELSKAYGAVGEYKNAYTNLILYDTLKDVVFTAEADRRIAELQTEFKTAQKQATIDAQARELTSSRTQNLLISIIAFFLLLVSGIIYRNNRMNRQKNLVLEQQNEEKAFLLKEIHHRVKNNLQILSSLLNLQAEYIKDESVLDAVKEGLGRVDSMGLIHQKLYMGESVAAVNMSEYVKDLSNHLLDSYVDDEERVQIHPVIEIEEMDADMAIPLGLIINELITNSIKYAFPNGRKGEILVKLWKNKLDELLLVVADNGIGKSAGQNLNQSTSFGMDLIKILCQRFQGEISHKNGNGFQTQIRFRHKLAAK